MNTSEETEKRLLEAARQEANRKGWLWLPPVRVTLVRSSSERVWSILTNAHAVGSNIRMEIRESDLAILKSSFLPR